MNEWLRIIGGMLTGKDKPMYFKQNLFQCHFVHNKSYTDCPGIEHIKWPAANGMAFSTEQEQFLNKF
jgi:hypothetical protein